MYEVKTLNNIDRAGLTVLSNAGMMVNNESENPSALLVRSAKLHDTVCGDNLLAIGRAGVGTDNIPTPRCTEQGIVVFNSAGANAEAVVEMAVCSLVLASRDLMGGAMWAATLAGHPDVSAEVEAGKKAFVGPEIMGKTLGIIGLGNIGSRVARAAIALGMEVWGYDPYLSVETAWRIPSEVQHAQDLATIYRNSDYILIQVHETDATRGMLNAEAFSQMKDGVRLINLARGGLVNDDDLLAALASGKMARYVTDFANEKLFGVKNIVAFPHLGASTPESEQKCAVMAAQELVDYLVNGNIHNSVNLPETRMDRSGEARLCVIHNNVPRVINRMLDLIGAENINVENMINKARGDVAYTMSDLGSALSDAIVEKISSMEEVRRVRVL